MVSEEYIDNKISRFISSRGSLKDALVSNRYIGRRFDSHCGQAYFSSLPGVDIHSE